MLHFLLIYSNFFLPTNSFLKCEWASVSDCVADMPQRQVILQTPTSTYTLQV